jgi:hypothetical protein
MVKLVRQQIRMPFSDLHNKPLADQLKVLEDAYADLLMEDVDAQTLSQLWNNIKELRQQLGFPIHE